MSDHTESIEFSDEDREHLEAMGITDGETPSFHPVLHVWKAVLEPADKEINEKVTPQYAQRILATYRFIGFEDMNDFRDRFYSKIMRLREILLEIIASDDECLTYTTPEEDVEHNSKHYRTALLEWQKEFLRWELAWDTMDPAAAVELATIGEVHRMFFSDQGLTAQLQMIQFQYTEQDQAEVQAELRSLSEEGGDGE